MFVVFLIALSVIFAHLKGKNLAVWIDLAALLCGCLLLGGTIMELFGEGVGCQPLGDRSAWEALKRPFFVVVTFSGILTLSYFVPQANHAGTLSFEIASDVLLVASIGFFYWAHEARRLGLDFAAAREEPEDPEGGEHQQRSNDQP